MGLGRRLARHGHDAERGRDDLLGRAGLEAGDAHGQRESDAVRLERLEQGLRLQDDEVGVPFLVRPDQISAEHELEALQRAAEIGRGQEPVLGRLHPALGLDEGLDLIAAGVDDTGVIGDERPGGECAMRCQTGRDRECEERRARRDRRWFLREWHGEGAMIALRMVPDRARPSRA
ncbi:MAG TPA: hypothetical protein VLD36_23985 [Burkholderiales bacterium]|nr:hypothetical protein [Burkholderiales bacterium]